MLDALPVTQPTVPSTEGITLKMYKIKQQSLERCLLMLCCPSLEGSRLAHIHIRLSLQQDRNVSCAVCIFQIPTPQQLRLATLSLHSLGQSSTAVLTAITEATVGFNKTRFFFISVVPKTQETWKKISANRTEITE